MAVNQYGTKVSSHTIWKSIQKAIKHPGALHKQLGTLQGKTIPQSLLHRAAEKGGVMGRRARLAVTLKKPRRRK